MYEKLRTLGGPNGYVACEATALTLTRASFSAHPANASRLEPWPPLFQNVRTAITAIVVAYGELQGPVRLQLNTLQTLCQVLCGIIHRQDNADKGWGCAFIR
jgi:hypothetical protein